MSHQQLSHKERSEVIDESWESEIVIHPDGRIFAFGITLGIVDVLAALPSSSGPGRRALDRIRATVGGPLHE